MDIPAEEEKFLDAVIPAVVRRKHIVILPHIGTVAEIRDILV